MTAYFPCFWRLYYSDNFLCKLWMIFRCIFGASLGGSGLSGVTVSHRKDRVHRVYCCSDGASKCSFGTVSGFTWVAAGCIHAVEIQISMHSRIPQSHSKVGRCEASQLVSLALRGQVSVWLAIPKVLAVFACFCFSGSSATAQWVCLLARI